MHADTLLWDRDLLARGSRGHVDVPRLLEANVALQCFTVVTKSPRGQNIEENSADAIDNITLLALVQGWPPVTYRSLLARALHQSDRLQRAADASGGRLRVVRWREELETFLEDRAERPAQVAGVLGIEGAHCLEARLESLDALHEAGYRVIGLTHFFDNAVGGSAHGEARGGLSDFGGRVLSRMEELGILVDLAHASPALIDDVLERATRPVVVSHTGVQGVVDNPRNLSDAQLRGIARGGGLIGIGFWETATGGTDAAAIARSIRYAVDLVGIRHVALGSDFDGSVAVPFDVTGLPLVTDALLAEGFGEEEVRAILGENLLRLLLEQLPASPR
jgi:microsomal dipeptidase-like Zn-dependent dipeptidase